MPCKYHETIVIHEIIIIVIIIMAISIVIAIINVIAIVMVIVKNNAAHVQYVYAPVLAHECVQLMSVGAKWQRRLHAVRRVQRQTQVLRHECCLTIKRVNTHKPNSSCSLFVVIIVIILIILIELILLIMLRVRMYK